MIKINDRVVCISKLPNHNTIIGREYIVYGINVCSCGKRSFDVGVPPKNGLSYTTCVICHNHLNEDVIQYIAEFRFRKIEEATTVNYVKLEVEIEEPILN